MRKILFFTAMIAVSASATSAIADRTWILGCTKTPTLGTYSSYRSCDDAAREHQKNTGHNSGCR